MKSFENPVHPSEISIDDARVAIEEAKQRAAVMGTNDSEFWVLDKIRERLDKGEIGPEQAAEEARSVVSGKQDYH